LLLSFDEKRKKSLSLKKTYSLDTRVTTKNDVDALYGKWTGTYKKSDIRILYGKLTAQKNASL